MHFNIYGVECALHRSTTDCPQCPV